MFFFPTEFTCLKMSWYDEEFLEMKKHLELINKSFASAQYDISKENYLLNFNWFLIGLKVIQKYSTFINDFCSFINFP